MDDAHQRERLELRWRCPDRLDSIHFRTADFSNRH